MKPKASFASTVDTSESLLDLLFVAQQPVTVTIGRSLGRADQLLQTLACVEPSIEHDFKILNESVMAHSHRVSGCICVLLEWDHARQKLLQQLIAVGVPCMVLLVTEQVGAANRCNFIADYPYRNQDHISSAAG